jgi:hypothetical protein
VLALEFVTDLDALSLSDLRARRKDAEQEEADLSFTRRMLHGRMDIVKAELVRRSPEGHSTAVVDDLSAVLGDEHRSTHGLGRHITVEPSRVDEHRRDVEQAISDAVTSDIEARSDDELGAALTRLRAYEVEVSEVRRNVQRVMDTLSAELTARYRDGSATVEELLAPEAGV